MAGRPQTDRPPDCGRTSPDADVDMAGGHHQPKLVLFVPALSHGRTAQPHKTACWPMPGNRAARNNHATCASPPRDNPSPDMSRKDASTHKPKSSTGHRKDRPDHCPQHAHPQRGTLQKAELQNQVSASVLIRFEKCQRAPGVSWEFTDAFPVPYGCGKEVLNLHIRTGCGPGA